MQDELVVKVMVLVVMREVTEKEDQNSPRVYVFSPRTASPLVVNKTYLKVQMHY